MTFRIGNPLPHPSEGSRPTALTRWIPVLLFLAVIVLCYRQELAGDRLPYYRDITQNYRPVQTLVQQEIGSGRLPLWNPYQGLGRPLMANPNHLVLQPATLFLLGFGVDRALVLGLLTALGLGLFGTYLLLRDLSVTQPAAVLGAFAFGLSGLYLSLGNLPNLMVSASWIPLCLYWARKFANRPSPGRSVLAALALGLLWSTGEAASLFTFFLIAPILVLAPTAPVREDETVQGASPARRLLRLSMLSGTGLLLAAIQWIPFLELVRRSRRGTGFPYEVASQWSLAPLRLVEFLIPGLFGAPTSMDIRKYWGLGHFDTGFPLLLSVYTGVLVLFLAGVCLFRHRTRWTAWLWGAAALSLLLSLGKFSPLHRLLFEWVPGFATIRYPIRFLLAGQMALALLAAIGLDRLLRLPAVDGFRSRAGTKMLGMVLPVIPVLAAMGGIAVFSAGYIAPRLGLGTRSGEIIPQLERVIRDGLLRGGALLLGALVLAWLFRARKLGKTPCAWAVCALVVLDLLAANRNVDPRQGPGYYRADLQLVSFLQAQGTGHRVQRTDRPPGLRIRFPDASVSWGYAWDRETLSRSTPSEFGIRMGYGRSTDHLDLSTHEESIQRMDAVTPEERLRVWCRSGVRFLTTYEQWLPESGLREVFTLGPRSDPPLRVYELPCALPHAYAVAAARHVDTAQEAWDALKSESFPAAGAEILQGDDHDGTGPESPPDRFPCRIIVDRPGRVELEVQAPTDGYAVLLENRFPGWKAWVDGRETPIMAANGPFQAVAVPAGDHRVVFAFRPGSYYTGGFLSLLGLGLAVGVLPRAGRSGLRHRHAVPTCDRPNGLPGRSA